MRATVLKLIPASIKEPLKRLVNKASTVITRFFSQNGIFASAYYLFFDRSFYREHRATLMGKVAFQEKLSKVEDSSALLRRNIHRLEKGLIMRPRRAVFAENYISETVSVYRQALTKTDFCQSETQWAYDVLSKYFDTVEEQGRIVSARSLFVNSPTPRAIDSGQKSTPYAHAELPALEVEYSQLLALFTRRRSVRWFQQRKVEPAILTKAVNAATLAPSACNRQPFFFQYTLDPDRATEIADCAMGTVGFSQNLPALIVVTGDLSNYPAERDRHVIYIDAALASMQLMLSLETLGLSTCPINWPDVESRERLLQEKLNLQYYERPVMLIAVGYADAQGGIPYSQKKGPELLLREMR